MKKDKKGMISIDELLKWLLGVFILVIIIIGLAILAGKGGGAIDYIKDLFRFR